MSLYLHHPRNYSNYVSRDIDFFAIMREIQYFYLMHATKLKEDRLSLSKSDKLTSKVYLRIYYSLRTRGCYLHTALRWTFLRAYPRYMYNILRIAGTFSAFLLKILCHYLVHPEYASKNILFRDCTNDSWSCWTKSALTSLIRSRSRRRSYSRICCLEV